MIVQCLPTLTNITTERNYCSHIPTICLLLSFSESVWYDMTWEIYYYYSFREKPSISIDMVRKLQKFMDCLFNLFRKILSFFYGDEIKMYVIYFTYKVAHLKFTICRECLAKTQFQSSLYIKLLFNFLLIFSWMSCSFINLLVNLFFTLLTR